MLLFEFVVAVLVVVFIGVLVLAGFAAVVLIGALFSGRINPVDVDEEEPF